MLRIDRYGRARATPNACTDSLFSSSLDAHPPLKFLRNDADDTAPVALTDTAPVEGRWRSAFYPEDWTPAFTVEDGRFLHDHSYAGYHGGDAPLPSTRPVPVVSVLDHGADPSGIEDSADAL